MNVRHLKHIPARRAVTLIELLVVLVVLTALAGIVLVRVTGFSIHTAQGDKSPERIATEATMRAIADAIVGTTDQPGFLQDVGDMPEYMEDLFVNNGHPDFDPVTRRGWRGPYIRTHTGSYAVDAARGFTTVYYDGVDDPPSPTLLDAWGDPIVIQYPDLPVTDELRERNARLVSAGPDGELDTPRSAAHIEPGDLDEDDRDDDIILFLRVTDTNVSP